MTLIILVILLLNIISAGIIRFAHSGRLVCNRDFPAKDGRVILIAGMLSQPESAYKYLEFPKNRPIGYLRFSNFGFNPKSVMYQLNELLQPNDIIVGVSIGCKPIIMSDTECKQRVLINPMTHSIILKAKNQMLIEYLAPEAEVLTYLLGWLALIPFIKSDTGDHYSLALLIDQLFWMYYGDPNADALDNLKNVGIVISSEDEFLENKIMSDIYKDAIQIEIDTHHGHTANPNVSDQYQYALDFIF